MRSEILWQGWGVEMQLVELLKPLAQVRLLLVLTNPWQSGATPFNWKRELIVPNWNEEKTCKESNNYCGITLFDVPGNVAVHQLIERITSHVLMLQNPEQLGFALGKLTTNSLRIWWDHGSKFESHRNTLIFQPSLSGGRLPTYCPDVQSTSDLKNNKKIKKRQKSSLTFKTM